jgi:O-antigen ligase
MIPTSYLLALGLAAMLAVGRVYDERLSVAGLSLSLVISAVFALAVILGTMGVLGSAPKETRDQNHRAIRLCLIPLALLAACLAVHSILVPADNPVYAQEKLITFGLITAPSCLLVIQQRSALLVRSLVICLAGVGALLVLSSLPNIASALTGDASYGRAAQRLSMFGGGPIVYARWVLTAALVIALSGARFPFKVAAVLVALLAAVLAQSKGPVVFFALSLGLVALLHALVQRKRLRAAGIVAAGAAFAAVAPRAIEAMGLGGRLLTLFDPGRLLRETSSTARLDVLSLSADMVRDHPFGVGLGNWGSTASNYVVSVRMLQYPHNVFVEIAAELGLVVALVAVAWILWASGSSARRVMAMVREDHPRARLAVMVLALFVFYLLGSMVSGDLSDARLMFVTLAMLVAMTSLPASLSASPVRTLRSGA